MSALAVVDAVADLTRGPPPPPVYRDVVVGPLLEGSSKSKLVFEVHPLGVPLVQTKSYLHRLMETAVISEMPESRVNEAELVCGPVIYAGPYLRHFGHFVAEGIHRLYAKTCFSHLVAARVVFLGSHRKYNPIVPWLADVLDVCGVDINDVIILDRPMRFEELYVPLQGRVLGGLTLIDGYSDFFPPRKAPPTRNDRLLYFTRSNHIHGGSYFGESLIEGVLREANFEIIHPERLNTKSTVELLREASVCIFCEGSAVHNLELSGRIDAKVGVISRRYLTRMRFSDILMELAPSWEIWGDDDRSGVHMDWNVSHDRPSFQRGCRFYDIAGLIADISCFLGVPLRAPVPDEIRAAVFNDVARYVLDSRSTENYTPDEKLGFLLRDLRTKWREFEASLV